MEIKKLINKVKDNNSKVNQAKKTLKNNTGDFDSFIPEETVKKGLGLKEGIFITIPETHEESLQIEDIPEAPLEIIYPEKKSTGNYIIRPGDTGKTIAKNVFGSEEMVMNLIEWKFINNKKDIIPGKEIHGLKYLDLNNQLAELARGLNLQVEGTTFSPELQKKILFGAISRVARDNNVPPVAAISVCSPDLHWMNIQGQEMKINYPINYLYWQPMQLNALVYRDAFPKAAMNIEFNIKYGINILKTLKKSQKTWSKTIIAYFLDSPVSIGKPAEQKIKAVTGIKILNEIISKMEKKDFEIFARKEIKPGDENFISYELLYRELIKYRNFIEEKYL